MVSRVMTGASDRAPTGAIVVVERVMYSAAPTESAVATTIANMCVRCFIVSQRYLKIQLQQILKRKTAYVSME